MNKGLQYYKNFIDGLVKRKNGVLSRWILEKGYPDNEENREYNELLDTLSSEQREVFAKLVQEARIGGIHDTLAYMNEMMDFDVVILGANFLYNIVSDMNYEQAQELMIQKASNALAIGGHVFIDCGYTQYPENWFYNPNANVIWEGTDSHGNFGKMILLDSVYDKESRINSFIRRFEMILADGSTLVQEIPSEKHFATLEQIHKWLAESGFVVEKECGDYQGNPICETTHRAIILAKKVSE